VNLFVTGGTGFIGSHFLRIALRAGHRVVAIRRPRAQTRIPLTDEPLWLEKELADCESHDFQGIDALVHFAAAGVNPKDANWDSCFKTNLTDSLRVWRTASAGGVKRLIVCGSCFEYGKTGERMAEIPTTAPLEPTGPYHASKAAATLAALALAHMDKLECAILRPFHVYGEGEDSTRFWPSLRTAALAGQDYPMTQGEQVRDFVAVEEVAARFLGLTVSSNLKLGNPEIHNIGSGEQQTLRAFAEHWWDKWEAKGKLIFGAIPYRENEVMRYVPQLNE
jgi:nucleoside-diphosphate-sugar epimerase